MPEHKAKDQLIRLFQGTLQFRDSQEYARWLQRLARFRRFSPFNAALIGIQRKGAAFVAREAEWHKRGYRLKSCASPIVILRPFGPVEFVYDILDVEKVLGTSGGDPSTGSAPGLKHQPLSPPMAKKLFCNLRHQALGQLKVRVQMRPEGSLQYGEIRRCPGGEKVRYRVRDEIESLPTEYDVVINAKLQAQERLVALAHELGHLLCGHLEPARAKALFTGLESHDEEKPRAGRRSELSPETKEFEAESVAYLFCQWNGLDSQSERYLATIVRYGKLPSIDLELVLTAAGKLITLANKMPGFDILEAQT